MKLDFRIDWGYQNLYSRRLYHPVFVWDGHLECSAGEISECYKLDYPYSYYGVGQCARETRLDAPEWRDSTKRKLSGVRFVADCEDSAVFTLDTAMGKFEFSAADVLEKRRIEFPVGPKYLGCFVTVTLTGYMWFFADAKPGETVLEADELGLPVHNNARMRLGYLGAGEGVKLDFTVPESDADVRETVIHITAMAVGEYDPECEHQLNAMIPYEVYCDGELACTFKRYYRWHDFTMQILEDSWVCVNAAPGHHTFELRNVHPEVSVGISRVKLSENEYRHGQLRVPDWSLVGESLVGKVFAAHEDTLSVRCGDAEYSVDCREGWNEFVFSVKEAGVATFTTETSSACIEVYDAAEEAEPVKVGYDMTVVPHDDTGFMDDLLEYTADTRLGNYVVFRSFNGDVPDELLSRWAEYCRTHGIFVSACNNYLSGALVRSAGELFSDCGLHEYPGWVYALDPKEGYMSEDMKTASERFMDFLKIEIDKAHAVSDTVAFGDASGGIRYSFLAGADFVRAETMVGPTMPLLSQARAAAESLGRGRWGVHIAIQHNYFPYRDTHLGQYFLSMMQPWAMGADTIYEEDSLFCLFKEERQTWDDRLTKGKRDMTRAFFKFAKTHPRSGRCVRNVGFIDGRYAAPFNGFICDCEQDPHYSVWGAFGNPAAEWGHGQPEKCHQVLDVLMPGASTLPLLQKHDKRRFFFSGTPYGDFDCVPVEASADYFKNYKLLLNLGWNTALDEDTAKLKSFVEDGGVLLTGIPQFSTHTRREFLRDMEDLALVGDGDLSELCGIRVKRSDTLYCGQWNCANREDIRIPELSAMPSDCPCEDGKPYLADVELAGAETVAWDSFTGKPMLVRNRVGRGWVYTFTFWAYPGHEQFMSFSAAWVARLAKLTLPETHVEDESGEVFWTRWEDGDTTRIMLLNTDWTVPGNRKTVRLVANGERRELEVREGTLLVCEIGNGKSSITEYTL